MPTAAAPAMSAPMLGIGCVDACKGDQGGTREQKKLLHRHTPAKAQVFLSQDNS
jgi:hypothetical protein